ncbi:ABC transporter ATP-binding protein [Aerococcus sp. HMSC10H05]|uniref:ABC transporter ATP-binding protein n=1 Tax=Aerococcus sp. HMSC10H05 TaxID=1581084 RepID=UPI0008A4FD20|nr:ABC transporter ATP-binding protein [Aerococcus sp. HMSC10H05]OFU53398.1 heme ABC transporter ATP-binding protein [Aerococcus sp. HMSC10H05]
MMNLAKNNRPVDSNLSPAIEFKHISFKYASQAEKNLTDISFSIQQGEKVLIIGASGSGKSTIGKLINGQIPNTFEGDLTGQVLINGVNSASKSIFDLSLNVGTVLQDTDAQFVGLTVAEDLAFALENDQVDQASMMSSVAGWANTLDLVDLLDLTPQSLSGGQKQRVSIGGVLIDESPIVLFDEPLANLDPASGLATMELIAKLNQEKELTTVVIEHRLEEALVADFDRVLVIDNGHLLADMSVDALLRSDLLKQIGVRQPLYLDAFNYAGVPIQDVPNLGRFRPNMVTPTVANKLSKWIANNEETPINTKKDPILKIEELYFSYDSTPLISNLELTIHAGEMISIVGTNGAGKSTLAKLICGFEQPDSGRMTLFQKDLSSLSIKEIADSVGYVMQNPNLMISKNILFDEVASGLVNRGLYENNADGLTEKVADALRICGLYPYRNWPISALSYGQKRRATIASILVLDPKVLILDEPTAGQDYKHYTDMMRFIKGLNRDQEITILMITHDMHLIQEYTNRTIVFHDGQVMGDMRPAAVLTDENLMAQAHLAPTSLYDLGRTLPFIKAADFIDQFIQYERQAKIRKLSNTWDGDEINSE